MDADKRVKTLEEEFKLLKGELKQTLSGIRDYLHEVEMPSSEYASVMEVLKNDSSQKIVMEGNFSLPKAEESSGKGGGVSATAEELKEESLEPAPNLEEPEAVDQPRGQMEYTVEPGQSAPPANMLASLVRWASNARRELGVEQLPLLLEVYGSSGYLDPELKQMIMQLADVTVEQIGEANLAERWSRLILELHGILTGDNGAAHIFRPFSGDGESDMAGEEAGEAENGGSKREDKPMKLKLLLSDGDSSDQEFEIDLGRDRGGKKAR